MSPLKGEIKRGGEGTNIKQIQPDELQTARG